MTTISIKNLTINVGNQPDPFRFVLGELKLPGVTDLAASNEAAKRYVTSEDGTTVTDTKTGLMWSQDKVGGKSTYENAEKAVAECRLGGHDDWRMPTRTELESILDLERHNPAIDPAFACDTNYWYWTSTPYAASSSDGVWIVGFGNGNVSHYRRGNAFVRAVRAASPAGQ